MSEEIKEPLINNEELPKEEIKAEDTLVVDQKKKGKRVKKPKSKARKIIEWVLTIVFGALFLVAAAAQVDGMVHKNDHFGQNIRFGWGNFLVLTDSMEPVYPKDTAIVTYLDDVDDIYNRFQNGETIDITFMNINVDIAVYPDDPTLTELVYSNRVMTHRIREIHVDDKVEKGSGKYVFITAGINTGGEFAKERQYQKFTEKEVLGVVKIGSKFLGGLFNVLSSPFGLLIFLLIPALYLVITSSLDILKALKEPEEEKAGVTPSSENKSGESKLNNLSAEERKKLKEDLLKQMMEERKNKKNEEK